MPSLLPGYISGDWDLTLRQIIAVRDKIIRKPRRNSLRNFNVEAYTDRVQLAEQLWQRFERRIQASVSDEAERRKLISGLRDRWDWKAHPYAEAAVMPRSPENDVNLRTLQRLGGKLELPSAALGGLNNVWQLTLKDTSLVSVGGLQEIMRVAAIAA